MAALATLAAGGSGAIVLARRPRAALAAAVGGAALAGLLSVVAALGAMSPACEAQHLSARWPLPIGAATLSIDGLSAWFLLAVGIVSFAVALYSWGYFQSAIGREPVWAAGALLNLLVATMLITVCAADVIVFLIGWELMSLSAFLLVGFHHRDRQTRHGAWMYLVATHLGTAFGVLPMFGLFAARAGSTSFAAFSGAFGPADGAVCVGLFVLGFLGFGTKAGLVPMHVWLPEAHPVAPSPVSALMSGVVIKMGIYGLLRLLTWLPALPRACSIAVIAVAVVTGVMGILYALPQRQFKRMLAYSSVENIGIIALGIGLGMLGQATRQPALAALGYAGALLHVLNHALFKGLLFLSAGAVLHGTGVGDVERLGGLARRDPRNAALFALGCVAICALPPLNGFVGEFLIYSGLVRGAALPSLLVGATALVGAGALALIGGLALAAFSKLFAVVFLGQPRDATIQPHATPPSMIAGMSVLAGGCLIVAIGAPLASYVLERPLAMITHEPAGAAALLREALAPLQWVSGAMLLVASLAAALFLLRRRLRHREFTAAPQVTWGCGFAAPSPRMQYSGSSYVGELVHSFRQLLRSRRAVAPRAGCFPANGRLSTQTPDAAVELAYRPAFRAVARTFEKLWPLQHGRIQLYLAYIAVTLLLVFAAEAWYSPLPNGPAGVGASMTSAAGERSDSGVSPDAAREGERAP